MAPDLEGNQPPETEVPGSRKRGLARLVDQSFWRGLWDGLPNFFNATTARIVALTGVVAAISGLVGAIISLESKLDQTSDALRQAQAQLSRSTLPVAPVSTSKPDPVSQQTSSTDTDAPSAAPSTEISPPAPPVPASGAQVGSYTIDLSSNHSVVLSATAPTQSQFSENSDDGDIYYYFYDGVIQASQNDQLISLPGVSAPTYQACTSGTVFENTINATYGAKFCVKQDGFIVGITVSSVNSDLSYLVLQVTVWKNS
jgi:hypothetical protein